MKTMIIICILISTSAFILLAEPLENHSINNSEDEMIRFADFLMSDKDYFRAIGIYKQVYFFSKDSMKINYCLLQISKAYLKSDKNILSLQYIAELLNKNDLNDELLFSAHIIMGLNYYAYKNYTMALQSFEKADAIRSHSLAQFYSALIEAEKMQWESASEIYSNLALLSPDPDIVALSQQLKDNVKNGKDIPQRSPFFAAVLSTIIPGAGQLYSGHFYDGLQSFLYVGVFTAATVGVYLYDSNVSGNYIYTIVLGCITGIFHFANIIGAYKTADYFNMRQKQVFMEPIREKAFSINF